MKFVKPSLPGMGFLFAAVVFLSISMSAQQEVSPDHFDDNPVVTKKAKPAAKPAKQVAAKKPLPASHAALKPKAAPAQHESEQSSAAPVQTALNR
jgi:Na+-transporting methylmalonyl-CoA/oxaloacetate decarboxylase gamma subunit